MKVRLVCALAATLLITVLVPAGAQPASYGSEVIAGTIGEQSDSEGTRRYRAFVGNPAPAGYDHWYMWGSPYVETASPETTPVTLTGTLDLGDVRFANGEGGAVGLYEVATLAAGERTDRYAVFLYVAPRNNGTNIDVGISDGRGPSGEYVQRFVRLDATDLADATVYDVTFTVDGQADPASCASHIADIPTADGCATLTINGQTITDSYGTITTGAPEDVELDSGAHPGEYFFYADVAELREVGSGIGYQLTVEPTVIPQPTSKDDCKKGGYADYGFSNQGQCIRYVNTGEDSRT
ncbi:hypothetical protein [Euzebya pacifica]|uniref:hypothetical protein n=1 Tax=Euzebya pacifica TaxID=1608957 RepID=UPI0013DFB8B5|nr:hypothetical protein [Euzebya pacifica]